MNATLAGGVTIGSASSLLVSPAWAMVIGLGAGALSAAGFLWIGAYLQQKIKLYDTCGIHNLHGMPGVFGGLCGAIAVMNAESLFTWKWEGKDKPASVDTASMYNAMPNMRPPSEGVAGYTANQQALVQLQVLALTLVVALVTGAFTGFIASKCGSVENLYDDKDHWDHIDKDEVEVKVSKKSSIEVPRRASLVNQDPESTRKMNNDMD